MTVELSEHFWGQCDELKAYILDLFYTSGKRIIALGQGWKFIIRCCFVYLPSFKNFTPILFMRLYSLAVGDGYGETR